MTFSGRRLASRAVSRLLLAALAAAAAANAGAQWTRARREGPPPVQLRCESLAEPIGIDEPRPRFSWIGSDSRRGAAQSAYRILVASEKGLLAEDRGDLWDSGVVASDRSVHVPYDGVPLRSSRRSFFKVRTWDGRGDPSRWSEVSFFETGLLDPSEWRASWIGPREGLLGGRAIPWGEWIWGSGAATDGETLFFRASVEVEDASRVEQAALKIVADDAFALFINGNLVETSATFGVRLVDARAHVVSGTNTIAVRAQNADGAGGLMAGGRIDLLDGRRIEFGTSGSWRVSAAVVADWIGPGFDDAGWDFATSLGPHGIDPWKKVEDDRGPRRSVYARKEFVLDRPVKEARLRVSGLGCYEVSINGVRVGDDVMAPGWTHYPARIQYRTHDVTAMLRPGANAVGALLGNGFWSGGLGWLDRFRYSDGSLRFIAEIDVVLDDGSVTSVLTDRSWKTHPSPLVEDSLYDGETHDARLEIAGWDEPALDDAAWEGAAEILARGSGRLVAQRYEPVRRTAFLPVVATSVLPAGETILDFGQNHAGRLRIRVSGERGRVVTLRFAEVLRPDGTLDTENLRAARATDRYVLRGSGVETWEPRFTYHGYRYVEVSGLDGPVDPAAFTSVVLHTDAPRTGQFRCSDPLLNRIQQTIVWSERSNLFNMITDCPQRDERMGWTGDALISSPTLVLNMGVGPVLSKWLLDVRDCQARDGAVTDVVPAVVLWGPAAPGWGDVLVTLPWTLYLQYGDTRVIEENYDAMKRWVEYMRANARDDLYEREGYGDWVALVPSPKAPIGAAFYYHSTRLLARMAAVIGREDDAREYAALAERIRGAFNAAYFDAANATYAGSTQTANVLPLQFGLVPVADEARVVATLADDVAANGLHLTTGFLGTAFVPSVLARGGRNDVFHAVATQRSYPSWGYMIGAGATTLWELWNADRDPEHPSMNSRNHPSLSSVGRWFYEELGGLKPVPAAPGYKRTEVRPYLPPAMTSAFAELATVHGRVASAWERTPDGIRLDVTLPPNTTGEIWVPLAAPEESASILEGGFAVVSSGAATERFGLEFLRFEAGYAVFDAVAGRYEFLSR